MDLRLRPFVGALTLVMATACSPEAGSRRVGGNEVLAPAADDNQYVIMGNYIVKSVNGAPPIINIEGHEPTITIHDDRIHFQSQCIYADWTYKRDGKTISTNPVLGGDKCARSLAPGETAIQDGFDKARMVRESSNGLYVEGGAHRLELHRVIERNRTDVERARR
ncbi:MAG TPA: hypothetical protein VEZ48_02310 [Sphingomonadaceae bacterium]|nr:hypothetical protein [Sphingomonadaceae bacterium]